MKRAFKVTIEWDSKNITREKMRLWIERALYNQSLKDGDEQSLTITNFSVN